MASLQASSKAGGKHAVIPPILIQAPYHFKAIANWHTYCENPSELFQQVYWNELSPTLGEKYV